MTREGIRNAVECGVDSIEYGTEADQETLTLMASKGVYFVPTSSAQGGNADNAKVLRSTIDKARAAHVKIANGFDAGSENGQGKNAREPISLVKFGLTPIEAIRAATTTAAELMEWQERIGSIETGKFADLIAVDGDPLADINALQRVVFIMKGGTVITAPPAAAPRASNGH
jgi:imidazolonepropionase-like amidohydrolase